MRHPVRSAARWRRSTAAVMTEVPAASHVLSPAIEPTRRVGKRWIALIALANLGLYVGYFAPLGVLLPNQVRAATRTSRGPG